MNIASHRKIHFSRLFLIVLALNFSHSIQAEECKDKLKYKFDSEDAEENRTEVQFGSIYQEEEKNIGSNKVAQNFRKLDAADALVKDGVYFPRGQNFSLILPLLGKGKVKITQKTGPLGPGEPDTFTAKFTDGSKQIAAVSTILLDWISEGTNMLSQFRKQQSHLVRSIPDSTYQFCEIEGEFGPGLELIVFNQIPSWDWPHKIVNRDENSPSIGIKREFHIGQSVVEFSLIVPMDPEDEKEDVIEAARERMDIFMGGYKR